MSCWEEFESVPPKDSFTGDMLVLLGKLLAMLYLKPSTFLFVVDLL